ncbi:MAG TPA: peptidylprolyl isomerase [Steroidobacteraceae bacterium]|nr:peptidylprolyl isomerase [Steroidobacteraceae bacterium]HNS28076.1 peptidylprolyl isomerase [Steroidobacteraceae bacterium]
MLRPFLAGLLAILAAGASHAQTRELSAAGELVDRVAAIVNDGVVLRSELDEQTAQIGARLRQQGLELPPENVLRQQILERLVIQEVQMQRAKRAGLNVTDEMVNNALKGVAERNGIPLAQLPQVLASQGVDYAAYRDSLRKEITLSMLRQRDVIARIVVTPRELDQYLEHQKNAPSESTAYNLSHILIAVPQAATPEQMAAAEQRAEDVHRRAVAGEDFAQLAVTYSNSQTALEGGALGWRQGPELPTVLAEAVIKLQAGEVSDVIRTPSGFHLVRVNEVQSTDGPSIVQQVHARHILMKPNELQDDATVEQRMNSIRDRIMRGEDFGGIATIVSEDPGSASEGGDLGWTSPGTFVPEFEAQLAALADGEISQPFRTQYGWHIVQRLGQREIDNSEEVKRQRAYVALRDSKAEEETELWLRRLRDEAYVELKM